MTETSLQEALTGNGLGELIAQIENTAEDVDDEPLEIRVDPRAAAEVLVAQREFTQIAEANRKREMELMVR